MPVRFGAKVTKSDTHEIEINLVPPGREAGEEVREASLDLALVDAIETIRAVVVSAADGDDPFVLNDAKIILSFAITAEQTIPICNTGRPSNHYTPNLP